MIEPVVKPLGYEEILRSDMMPNPGMISGQIIDMLLTSDLVIADMSFYNPNVFYELAIRHMTDLPFIHMVSPIGAKIPFDIKDMRTVFFGTDLVSCDIGRTALQKQVSEILASQGKIIDNPIRQALNGRKLKEWVDRQGNGTPGDISKAVLEELLSLREAVQNLDGSLNSMQVNSPIVNQVLSQEYNQVAPKTNPPRMEVTSRYDYIWPRITIAGHDLSGEVGNAEITLATDGRYKSWRVVLSQIDPPAFSQFLDLLNNPPEAKQLIIEPMDKINAKYPKASGNVLINRLDSSKDSVKATLIGTGPLDLISEGGTIRI